MSIQPSHSSSSSSYTPTCNSNSSDPIDVGSVALSVLQEGRSAEPLSSSSSSSSDLTTRCVTTEPVEVNASEPIVELTKIDPLHVPILQRAQIYFREPSTGHMDWGLFQKTLAQLNGGVSYSKECLQKIPAAVSETQTPVSVSEEFFSLHLDKRSHHKLIEKTSSVANRAFPWTDIYDGLLQHYVDRSNLNTDPDIYMKKSFWQIVAKEYVVSSENRRDPSPDECKERYLNELKIGQHNHVASERDKHVLAFVLRAFISATLFDFSFIRNRILALKNQGYTVQALLSHYKSLVTSGYDFTSIDAWIQNKIGGVLENKQQSIDALLLDIDEKIKQLDFGLSASGRVYRNKRKHVDISDSSKAYRFIWNETRISYLIEAFNLVSMKKPRRSKGFWIAIADTYREICKIRSPQDRIFPQPEQCCKKYTTLFPYQKNNGADDIRSDILSIEREENRPDEVQGQASKAARTEEAFSHSDWTPWDQSIAVKTALVEVEPMEEFNTFWTRLAEKISAQTKGVFCPSAHNCKAIIYHIIDRFGLDEILPEDREKLYRLFNYFISENGLDIEKLQIACLKAKARTYSQSALRDLFEQMPKERVTLSIRPSSLESVYGCIHELEFVPVDPLFMPLNRAGHLAGLSSSLARPKLFSEVAQQDKNAVLQLCLMAKDQNGDLKSTWLQDEILKVKGVSYSSVALEKSFNPKHNLYGSLTQAIHKMGKEGRKIHFSSLIDQLTFGQA